MPDGAEGTGHAFAFASFAISVLLLAFLVLRSPRNPFTGLLAALVGCVSEWNLFEWIHGLQPTWPAVSWPMHLQFVGIALLPAVLLHFAVSVAGGGRAGAWALRAGYAAAALFAALALGGLLSDPLRRFFAGPGYNRALLAAEGPVLALAIAVLCVRAFSGPPETRGVLRYVLGAAVPLGALGTLDLLRGAEQAWAPRLSNAGAALACGVLVLAAVRHRETFDSLSILRAESARLLARTRHGLVSFDAAGNATFTDELAGRILGGAPRTLGEVDASLPGLAGTGGERFLVRGDRVLKATLLGTRGRPGEGGRLHLLLEDRTAEARLLGEMAHRESLASLGEAAASVAHEIRNSLTAVGTALDTLGREARPDPAALRGLGEEVRRLGGALERSLSFASAIPLDRQSVDLGRLLRRVAGAAPPGPAVRVEAPGPAEVFADPDLLGRVVHNLLRNAAEAGAREVRLAVRREEGEAVVTVANDGPPLPPPVLARLFEPFVTGRPGGTGLGLALCRKIVAAHGGRISGGNVGGGVEFEVRLPWTS